MTRNKGRLWKHKYLQLGNGANIQTAWNAADGLCRQYRIELWDALLKQASSLDQNTLPQVPEKINWSLKGEFLVNANAPSFACLIEIVYLDEHPWTPTFETKLENYMNSLKKNDKLENIIFNRKDGLDKNDFEKWLQNTLVKVNYTH